MYTQMDLERRDGTVLYQTQQRRRRFEDCLHYTTSVRTELKLYLIEMMRLLQLEETDRLHELKK